MNLVDPDGALFRGWSRWWFWAWTSCCWLLLSLPVVTMPAATLWLLTQQRRYSAGEPVLGANGTVRYLARWLFPALPLAGCHLGIACLVAIGLLGPSPGGLYGWVVLVTSVLSGVTWLLVAPWSVVRLEHTGRAIPALVGSYRLALSRVELALTSTVSVCAATFVVPFLATRVPYLGPLLLVAAPAATAALVLALHDRAATLQDACTDGSRIGAGSVPARMREVHR